MLAATLSRHHLILKYHASLLGFGWTLLSPLGSITVLVLVFSFVVRIDVERYWAFLLSAYFVWVFIQHVVGGSTGLFRDYAALRRSIAFPNEVVLLGAGGARMVEFLAELVLVLVVLATFHHRGVPASFVVLPGLIVLQALLGFALALPLATLALLYHDVEHGLPIAMGFLFYASPVFYPAEMVPETVRWVYMLNPVAGLLTMYHEALYGARFPDPALALTTTVTVLVLLVAGYAYFNRHRGVLPELV
jgi:ABC-2 type transport system permease protein